jgi:hypothetical protein
MQIFAHDLKYITVALRSWYSSDVPHHAIMAVQCVPKV